MNDKLNNIFEEITAQYFVEFCTNYGGAAVIKARSGEWVAARRRLIQVAALAVAAIQMIDRKTRSKTFICQ